MSDFSTARVHLESGQPRISVSVEDIAALAANEGWEAGYYSIVGFAFQRLYRTQDGEALMANLAILDSSISIYVEITAANAALLASGQPVFLLRSLTGAGEHIFQLRLTPGCADLLAPMLPEDWFTWLDFVDKWTLPPEQVMHSLPKVVMHYE